MQTERTLVIIATDFCIQMQTDRFLSEKWFLVRRNVLQQIVLKKFALKHSRCVDVKIQYLCCVEPNASIKKVKLWALLWMRY